MIDYFVVTDEEILNNAWRFLNSKSEQNEKILRNFYYEMEDENLEECCKDAIDRGFDYCPDCGNDISGVEYSTVLNSYKMYPDKRFSSVEEFEQYDIEYNDYEEDYFDTIDVYEEIRMASDLYYKIKDYLEQKKE